jgi:hypothetical protein
MALPEGTPTRIISSLLSMLETYTHPSNRKVGMTYTFQCLKDHRGVPRKLDRGKPKTFLHCVNEVGAGMHVDASIVPVHSMHCAILTIVP